MSDTYIKIWLLLNDQLKVQF